MRKYSVPAFSRIRVVHWAVEAPYPGEDGEEGECDGCPGSVPSLPQRVVLMLGHLPLVRQETETHEPHEGPERWRERERETELNNDK